MSPAATATPRADLTPPGAHRGSVQLLKPSVGVFREGIDFSIENTVPNEQDYMQRLTQRVADNHELCEGAEERAAIDHVMRLVDAADFAGHRRGQKLKQKAVGVAGKQNTAGASLVKARAVFEYQQTYEGDLALAEDDIIVVLSQGEDGWWEGDCSGRRGRFPGNYVVVLEDDADVAAVGAEPEEEEPALGTEQVQEQEQEQEQEEEQQKEQQVEQEVEHMPEPPQEPARQKYSRDDERPIPWPLAALDRQPEGGAHGFYSWSEFKVRAAHHGRSVGVGMIVPLVPVTRSPPLLQWQAACGLCTLSQDQPRALARSSQVFKQPAAGEEQQGAPHIGLGFPPAMLLTNNFYKPRHAENPRRLKNVVVVMEWCPEGRHRLTTNATGLSKLGPVPMEQLGAVYQLLGGTEDVGIPLAQLWELWRSMELPIDEPAEQQRLQVVLASARVQPHEHATVSFEQLCALMHPNVLQPEARGRFFVVLSLSEAESVRAVLHARGAAPLSEIGNPASIALHLLHSSGGTTMLESSSGHEHSSDGEFGMVHQCLRYIDSNMEYSQSELTLLLRGLQENEGAAREAFFAAVCSGRRRVQHGWSTRSVTKVFSLPHELCILRQTAIMTRVKT